MWKVLAESVTGTGHVGRGVPCQDVAETAVIGTSGGPVLVVVVADGAGSATHAEVGARVACAELVRRVGDDLCDGLAVGRVDDDQLAYWLTMARAAVLAEADRLGCPARELASTVLLAVVGGDAAGFAQVGDGVILLGEGDAFAPVFWPEPAGYANCTDFLTDPDFPAAARYGRRDERVDKLAVLSDGLQRLALDYATRVGHPGFFRPLFDRLRTDDADALRGPLREFLDSPRVNLRTDDDKTLILATRVPPRADAAQPG